MATSRKAAETAARMNLSFQRQAQAEPSTTRKRAPRQEHVRITLDLEPTLHRDMKRWAVDNDAKLVDVARILFARLLEHPPTAAAVRQALDLQKDK